MAFVLSLSFLLLLVAFRSIVIPIKAILLNLLSTGAAFGLMVVVFQEGWLDGPLGFKPGPIEAFVPVFIFTILFGLSMDYHVFILTRIKEARDHGMSSNEAVARGISITSGTITSAAAIMVVRLRGLRDAAAHDHQAARVRARGRGAHRRDDRPLHPPARHDAAPRGVELVAAALARLAAPRDDRGRRRRGAGCRSRWVGNGRSRLRHRSRLTRHSASRRRRGVAGSRARSAPGGARLVRVEADPAVRLAAARARHEVGSLGHLVLEPADVGVLRRELDRLRAAVMTSPIASSISRSAASRGSTSSAKIDVSDACIWRIVLT